MKYKNLLLSPDPFIIFFILFYFGIDKEIVWDILKYKLPELKIEIEGIINKIENKKEVIEFFIEDNLFIPSVKKVLEKIKNEI